MPDRRVLVHCAVAGVVAVVLAGCGTDGVTEESPGETPSVTPSDTEIPVPGIPDQRIDSGRAVLTLGTERWEMPSICTFYAETAITDEELNFTAHSHEEGTSTSTWDVGVSGAVYVDSFTAGTLIWTGDVSLPPEYGWQISTRTGTGEVVHSVAELSGYLFASGWFESRRDGEGVALGDRMVGSIEIHC